MPVPVPKWIDGTPDVRSAARIRDDDGATNSSIVRRREGAHPRVEQLHGVGAGPGLRHGVGCERLGELVDQGVPDGRLPVHERLRDREVAGRLAFDQIAGDGERPAAEADDRLFGRQLRPDERDRLEDRRDRVARLRHVELGDRGHRPDRLADDRADALDELDVDAHRRRQGS